MAERRSPAGKTEGGRPSSPAERPGSDRPNRAAADQAVSSQSPSLRLPALGRVSLPPGKHLAWYVGVGALAVAEVIEWPVALVLALGKALADNRSSQTIQEFGEALDEGV